MRTEVTMNRPEPYDYQVSAIEQIKQAMAEGHKRVLLVLPTGAGKTTVASEVIYRTADKGNKTMFIAHRGELVKQANSRLQQYGVTSDLILPSQGYFLANNSIVASQQTLIKRDMPDVKLAFIDEAHRSVSKGYKVIADRLEEQGSYIIGLTATPYRLDGKPLGDIYTKIIAPVSTEELIKRNKLVRPRYIVAKAPDFSDVQKVAGDYNAKQAFQKFDKREHYEGVVEKYLECARDSRAVAFCVNIKHSKETCDMFNKAGVKAVHIDGSTEYQKKVYHNNEYMTLRQKLLLDYIDGKYDILCNCDLLTEGWDVPSIETVILDRKTCSKTLYKQMIGRGARTAPGKDGFLVLDFGENWEAHGYWEDDGKYSLDGKQKKVVVKDVICPNCLQPTPKALNCKHCGFQLAVEKERQEQKVTKVKGKFYEVSKETKVMKPLQLQSEVKLKPLKKLGHKPVIEMTDKELWAFIKKKGYPSYYFQRYKKMQKGEGKSINDLYNIFGKQK